MNKQLGHEHHKTRKIKHPICFLAHDINLPGNIGSLFRIADALGVEKIYLTGTSPVPPNDKIKRTSRSTEKYVPYSCEQDPLELVARLKSKGYKIVCLENTTSSIDLNKLVISDNDKICLILGSENLGVTQDLLDASDMAIHIPMLGHNSSMNVVIACSIATFEIARLRSQPVTSSLKSITDSK